MSSIVCCQDKSGRAYRWWANFLTDSGWFTDPPHYNLDHYLVLHNARAKILDNPIDTLRFETEADATVFMLKWG